MVDTLQNSFPFNSTDDQENALNILSSFLKETNKLQVFTLRGYAGTGKTTILAHLATYWNKNNNVVLMAPTGRAARVLSSYCGLPAFTVHKKIYRLSESSSGDFEFLLQRNNYVKTLFIVDEASMISSGYGANRDLLEDLMRFVYRGKGCRLILSGDTAQLPPVEMDTSPALDPAYLKDRFNMPVLDIELNQVVRQKEQSGILKNATYLRQLLQRQDLAITLMPNQEDFISINGLELQENLESCISEFGMDEVLTVTRSNKRANQFNAEIRNRLLFREENIESGDVIMSVKNNYHWLKNEDNKNDFIANGESMHINRVLGREIMYGYEFADLNVRFVDNRIPDVDVKVWLDCLTVEGPALPQFEARNLYYRVVEDYLAQGEKNPKKKALEDQYVNALQAKFSYAVTCHKAQGGQWKAVFIDHGYLTDEMVDENLIRWLYTAVTRASQRVYLVNFNPSFL